MNIKIIYDSENENKSRPCFWKLVKVDGNYNPQFISIQDALASGNPLQLLDLFDKDNTDIIILNWDSINNDPIYGSDRAYQFFDHYKPDLKMWVENGGILILEAQTAAWKLVQNSYNIFAKGVRTTKEREARGEDVMVNKKLMKEQQFPLCI